MRDKKFFYDEFAGVFDKKMNKYDLFKRIGIVFDELLPENLQGIQLLDAGCGTGWFSREAVKRHASVVSLDVGCALLQQVEKKCASKKVAGDVLTLPFKNNSFDAVISTEVIEHTVDPQKAIVEMYRVLKPDGLLVLTTPNRTWYFSVCVANFLGLRPYEGYENWVSWARLRNWFVERGFIIEAMKGFHVFPFIFPLSYPLLDYCDRFGETIGPGMLNIAIRARKKKGGAGDV